MVNTHLLIHIIYCYGYFSFKLNDDAIREIEKRIPSIMEQFVFQKIMMLTSGLALLGKSQKSLFNYILSNEKYLEMWKAKPFINIAFHIAMTKYDNFPQWEEFFKRVMLLKINKLDSKMLLDIIEFINLIDDKYKYFRDKYYKIIIRENNYNLNFTGHIQSKLYYKIRVFSK